VKLWRRFGVEVTLIPTGEVNPAWQAKLDAIGCRTIEVRGEGRGTRNENPPTADRPPSAFRLPPLHEVPGLPGSIVASLCNTKFLAEAAWFRQFGCKIVWLSCMNWLFPAERLHYRAYGCFDRHVFQSRYQYDQLVPQLRRFGYCDHHGAIIRGAFDVSEFPLRPLPHHRGNALVVGHIGRPAPDKLCRGFWQLLSTIEQPVRVRVLGWQPELAAVLGAPPPWAECLPAGAVGVGEFLRTVHVLVQLGGGAIENWPRVGLEAMAAGVPIVADNQGGWCELIEQRQTGLLCDDPQQAACYLTQLAHDEPFRVQILRQARRAVEDFANPNAFWSAWKTLLEDLQQ
jgi:glycosyltransferase involved in cell wall biosynthesis